MTTNEISSIRYHTIKQITAWLQGNIGIDGLAGDVDHYLSSFAVRSLLIIPLILFAIPKTAEYLTTGSTAKQFCRLLIQEYSVYGFAGLVAGIVIWSGCCLSFVGRGVHAP